MKAKYLVIGETIHKQTFDPTNAKYPFDTCSLYTEGGSYSLQNICDMLQAAYNAGARHALQELGYSLDKVRGNFQ